MPNGNPAPARVVTMLLASAAMVLLLILGSCWSIGHHMMGGGTSPAVASGTQRQGPMSKLSQWVEPPPPPPAVQPLWIVNGYTTTGFNVQWSALGTSSYTTSSIPSTSFIPAWDTGFQTGPGFARYNMMDGTSNTIMIGEKEPAKK